MATASGTVLWGSVQQDWYSSVNRLSAHTGWLHTPERLYAVYGVGVFAAILLASWWTARGDDDLRRVSAALWAPLGALLALGLNQFIGNAVAEPRPYTVVPHALVLVTRTSDYSFPSDHAVIAGAVAAGVLLARNRRLGYLTVVLALWMAFTRVYVGAHFPLDVIAGLIFGAVVVVASYGLVRPVLEQVILRLSRTPLRPLLTVERRRDAA